MEVTILLVELVMQHHMFWSSSTTTSKNPELHHHEIKSLLLTTVEPVSDAYGKEFSVHEAGAGRLDMEMLMVQN